MIKLFGITNTNLATYTGFGRKHRFANMCKTHWSEDSRHYRKPDLADGIWIQIHCLLCLYQSCKGKTEHIGGYSPEVSTNPPAAFSIDHFLGLSTIHILI